MKLTIESTGEIVRLDGVETRRWRGTTSKGKWANVYVHRVEVQFFDSDEFAAELNEFAVPSLKRAEDACPMCRDGASRHRFTILNLLTRVLDVTGHALERTGTVDEAAAGSAVALELSPELQQLGVIVGSREREALGVLALALARAAAEQQEDDG